MGGDGRWTAELVSRACALSGALLAATLPIWTIKIDGRMRCDSTRRKEERRRKKIDDGEKKKHGRQRATYLAGGVSVQAHDRHKGASRSHCDVGIMD